MTVSDQAREQGIREKIQPLIDILVEYYEVTDPRKSEGGYADKLEIARHAMFIWWELYDELMVWAQSQLAGYCIATGNVGFPTVYEQEHGTGLYHDAHFLEHLGQIFVWRRGDTLPESEAAEGFIETYLKEARSHGLDQYNELDDVIHPAVLRELMRELLSGESDGSEFWQLPARSGLGHLNEGQSHPVYEPKSGRKQGLPYDLKRWKLAALDAVHFRIGMGFKKYRALSFVADAIGQSPETLRDWEKAALFDEGSRVSLECAHLAGEFHELFKTDARLAGLDHDDYPTYRGRSYFGYAIAKEHRLKREDFAAIRNGLRDARAGKSGD